MPIEISETLVVLDDTDIVKYRKSGFGAWNYPIEISTPDDAWSGEWWLTARGARNLMYFLQDLWEVGALDDIESAED